MSAYQLIRRLEVRRQKVWQQAYDIADGACRRRSRNFTAAEWREYSALDAEFDRLDRQIRRLRKTPRQALAALYTRRNPPKG